MKIDNIIKGCRKWEDFNSEEQEFIRNEVRGYREQDEINQLMIEQEDY